MLDSELPTGQSPEAPKIKIIFEGTSNHGGFVTDHFATKYKDKDISRGDLDPDAYLDKVKQEFATEEQVVFLDTLNMLTRIAVQAPMAHKRMVDGLPVPQELTPDFTLQLPKTPGKIPTITLNRKTANGLINNLNVVRYKLQQTQEQIVLNARDETVDFINSGKPVTDSLPDRLRAMGEQVRLGLASMVVGRELTQEAIKKK